MVLEEGKYYPFKCVRKLDLEGEEYWIFKGPDEKKHLLNAESYKAYSFNEDKIYRCKVDKINCTGKVFIEPEHPYYKIGEMHSFKLIRSGSIINSFGDKEVIVIVEDKLGNEVHTSLPNNIGNGLSREQLLSQKKLKLKIDRIKKGKVLVSYPRENHSVTHLEKGKRYRFRIDGIATMSPEREFYRLIDETGAVHFIRQKFYQDHSFKKNDTINCTVAKEPEAGKYYLEPDYPGYQRGNQYSFRFIREDLHYAEDGSEKEVYIVADNYGKECTLFYGEVKPSAQQMIDAKVLHSFKGKLFLQAPEMDDLIGDSLEL